MTREDHLEFCSSCLNRKFDSQQGLVCQLTGEIADFEKECPNFSEDISTRKEPNDTEPLAGEELQNRISEQGFQKLKLEQNLPFAIFSGIIAGLIGASVWGAITVATNFQIGYMAIAVGAGVGITMRYFGKGIDPIFGILGGLLAVLSCVLGNFLSVIGFVANSEGLDYFQLLIEFDYSQFFFLMGETFDGMDLFFYAIAGYEGYRFAFRILTEKDLLDLDKNS